MDEQVSDLILRMAGRRGNAPALAYRDHCLSYEALADAVQLAARGLLEENLTRGARVGVFLEKRLETVVAFFAASVAGGVFVPVNHELKPRQVGHILRDCNVRILVTSTLRLDNLRAQLDSCPDLQTVIVVDGPGGPTGSAGPASVRVTDWTAFIGRGSASARVPPRVIDADMAAILYTSGSTGMPKGVVLSHRNLLTGARSVSAYLENTPEDRILAVLPLSFDAGFSQLTTAFSVGAEVVLLNYLLPQDVIRAMASQRITGLAGVPPLWVRLSQLDWPSQAVEHLRYITNTGGAMPAMTLQALRNRLPRTKVYLMYGLTEAFRSTYLDPSELDRRPDSVGKAIPGAEVLVVRKDGSLCGPGEVGELVHRGALAAMGYWNDPEATAERFRPAPGQPEGLCRPDVAVWTGDRARMDEEGFLYFVGRDDEMIKTSGYRVSPTEVEEVVHATGLVGEAAAIGVAHPVLGQGIVLVATAPDRAGLDGEAIMLECRRQLPAYMVPLRLIEIAAMPLNQNGKIDRRKLSSDFADCLRESAP